MAMKEEVQQVTQHNVSSCAVRPELATAHHLPAWGTATLPIPRGNTTGSTFSTHSRRFQEALLITGQAWRGSGILPARLQAAGEPSAATAAGQAPGNVGSSVSRGDSSFKGTKRTAEAAGLTLLEASTV